MQVALDGEAVDGALLLFAALAVCGVAALAVGYQVTIKLAYGSPSERGFAQGSTLTLFRIEVLLVSLGYRQFCTLSLQETPRRTCFCCSLSPSFSLALPRSPSLSLDCNGSMVDELPELARTCCCL